MTAITTTLSDRCDFAQLVKVYAQAPAEERRRYSPPDVTHAEKVPVMGNPDPSKICTSHVERRNLTIRMQMRRLTRLTNAFSKKWENLWAAYCLHFAYYQLLPDSQNAASDACDGSGHYVARVDTKRTHFANIVKSVNIDIYNGFK